MSAQSVIAAFISLLDATGHTLNQYHTGNDLASSLKSQYANNDISQADILGNLSSVFNTVDALNFAKQISDSRFSKFTGAFAHFADSNKFWEEYFHPEQQVSDETALKFASSILGAIALKLNL